MWFYRLLLWICPASFREEYSREMEGVHRRRLAQAKGWGRIGVWMDAISDIVLTGMATHGSLLVQDTRYAWRTARRSPGFSLAAIAVSALGIAAATSVFSIADHVLVRALPFADPERIVKIWESQPTRGFSNVDVSPPNYRDWKAASRGFSQMAAVRGLSVNLSGAGEPERLEGASVNASLFPLLGVAPLLGRAMLDEEDRPGAPGTVVLSHGYWQRRFGGDPSVLGRQLLFDGQPYTVIGVMPPQFNFPGRRVQMWTAMRFTNDDFADRHNNYLSVVARLRDGVSLEAAQQELRTITAQLAAQYPKDLENVDVTVMRLRDELTTRTRMMLSILMAAALFVLLIAMTNLANLFLARSAARQAEISVRLALGAGRARLVRQLFTESLLLAGIGGVAGTVLALSVIPLLARLAPSTLPVAAMPSADWRLLAFALLATGVTALGFGVLPALRSTRGQLSLRSATGIQKDRVRRILVVAQVAASIALISSTGLLLRALLKVESTNPGFATTHALAFRTSLPMPKYASTALRERFYQGVLGELRALPGVSQAGVISFRPLGDFRGGMWPPIVAGQESKVIAAARFVSPGYFDTMRIPLLRGRDIQDSDDARTLRVAVVSEAFVREFWPGETGIGKTFGVRYDNLQFTIAGVVGDVRFRGMERKIEPVMYFAHAQIPDNAFFWFAPKDFVVRASVDPMAHLLEIRRIVARADPVQPISDVQSLTELVEDETATRRTQVWVIASFAMAAFLLAAVGIHGLLSFSLEQRIPEMGLRRALGAQTSQIATLVFGEGMVLSLTGSAVGLGLAFVLGRSMESLLAGISPYDPYTLAAAAGLSVVMTIGGTVWPVIQAVLIDPAIALRSQ